MGKNIFNEELSHERTGLLKDQVRLIKRKGSERYEIVSIQDRLSYDKGFFAAIRACQLLAQMNDGLILVGIAGASGAGKTAFTERILNFMPSIAVISMDNYNDGSRVIDGNFDDPRLTDYDTLLKNIHDLKAGKHVEVPIYDFKASLRTGYRTIEVPSSRIVIIEGIYALSEKLQPLLDLRVSVTGGVHFDLVKRVFRDIHRAGKAPAEIIHQISETVYPMYKAYIEPDLETAHIRIINKFNPFNGFQCPTYILKSGRDVTVEQIKSVLPEEHTETTEETYDIYLLPPGEDPESCQSYLRMRNRDGKYNLMFEAACEEWVTDSPFVISPRVTFEVSVRLLGGLMTLGYTIAAILKRSSRVFCDERVSVKIDWLEQLNRQYIQVHGRDRLVVKSVAEQLGLEGSYVPRTYIEQIKLERIVNEIMAVPDDLKTKLSIDEDLVSSLNDALSQATSERITMRNNNIRSGMSHSYSTPRDKDLPRLGGFDFSSQFVDDGTTKSPETISKQGAIAQLLEHISTLNDRIDNVTSKLEELNAKFSIQRDLSSSQKAEACNGSAPTSYLVPGLGNSSRAGSTVLSSPSLLAKESPIMEEISGIARGQRQVLHQLENLTNHLRKNKEGVLHQTKSVQKSMSVDLERVTVSMILTLTLAGVGIFLFRGYISQK